MNKTANIIYITGAVALASFLFDTSSVHALSPRIPCPNQEAGASDADQALCWFDMDEQGSANCVQGSTSISTCIEQALSWCKNALLDAAPVANACFLSNIRAGKFDEAQSIARYLQDPSDEVVECRNALKSVTVRIVSVPQGAEVFVDERTYGPAPVEVKLIGNWRESRIVARFGSGADSRDFKVTSQELIDAFDKRACMMGDLLIEDPSHTGAALAPGHLSESQSANVTETERKAAAEEKILSGEQPDDESGISIAGIVLTTLGAGGIIAGSIVWAMAEGTESDIVESDPGTTLWSKVEDDYDGVGTQRLVGGVVLGGGVVMAAIGVVLLVTSGSGDEKQDSAGLHLRIAEQRIQGVWNF